MYGSSFMFATLRPRFSIKAPIDAETMPLPSDDTTPPVTNTNLVCCAMATSMGATNNAPEAFYRLHGQEAIGRCTTSPEAIIAVDCSLIERLVGVCSSIPAQGTRPPGADQIE